MEIYHRLHDDHLQIQNLLIDIATTDDRALVRRHTLFQELKLTLLAHSKVEEALLYDHLRADKDLQNVILEALHEHRLVSEFLEEIEAFPLAGTVWMANFVLLKEMIEHHILEDDRELFTRAGNFRRPRSVPVVAVRSETLAACVPAYETLLRTDCSAAWADAPVMTAATTLSARDDGGIMEQQIVIVEEASERVALMAQALRAHGYAVKTVKGADGADLHARLRVIKPDFLVISDDIIDLKAANSLETLHELGIACCSRSAGLDDARALMRTP